MKGEKITSCVVINSTLEQLRTELLEKGLDLLSLLKVAYPDAKAVLITVEKIEFLLQDQSEDISDQWVTARAFVGDKTKFISNLSVHKVSILSFFCIYCA